MWKNHRTVTNCNQTFLYTLFERLKFCHAESFQLLNWILITQKEEKDETTKKKHTEKSECLLWL